jgi:UrcA family protein
MSKLVSRVAAVAALALAATPIIGLTAAHAEEPTARITVGDLKLSNPADARQFAKRVEAAARKACDAYGNRAMANRACVADFKADVRDALSEQQMAELRTANRAGARITLASN